VYKSSVANVLITRLLAGVAAASVAAGGYALVSSTNDLTGTADPAASASAEPSTSVSVEPEATASSDPSGDATATEEPGEPAESSDPEPTSEPADPDAGAPTPSLSGLCNAFHAGATTHGNAGHSAAFQVLFRAAGGEDEKTVEAYCVTLVGEPKSHGKSGSHAPAPATEPTDEPTSEPSQTASEPAEPTEPAPSATSDSGRIRGHGRANGKH